MASIVENVKVVYKGDSKGLTKAMKDVEGKSKSMGSTISKATKLMAVGFLAMVAVITKSIKNIKDYSNVMEATNMVNVAFGESAQVIIDSAKMASIQLGISQADALQFMGTIGAMGRSTGLTNEQITEMSPRLMALSADLASMYNAVPSDVMVNLRSGLTGSTEALDKYGINIKVAAMEQYLLEKGINKSWNSLQESEKMWYRYQVILEQTSFLQGDFVSTSNELANAQRVISAVLTDISAESGKKFYKTFRNIVVLIKDALIIVLLAMRGELDLATESQKKMLNAVKPLTTLFTMFKNVVKGLWDRFVELTGALKPANKEMSTLGKVVNALLMPFKVLAFGIKAVYDYLKDVGVISAANTLWYTFLDILGKIDFSAIIQGLKDFGTEILATNIPFFNASLDELWDKVVGLAEYLMSGDIFGAIKTSAITALEQIDMLGQALSFSEGIKGLDDLKTKMSEVNEVSASGGLKQLGEWMIPLSGAILGVGAAIKFVLPLMNGIGAVLTASTPVIVGVIAVALILAAVFYSISQGGEQLREFLDAIKGLFETLAPVVAVLAAAFMQILDVIATNLLPILTTLINYINQLIEPLVPFINILIVMITNMFTMIVEAVRWALEELQPFIDLLSFLMPIIGALAVAIGTVLVASLKIGISAFKFLISVISGISKVVMAIIKWFIEFGKTVAKASGLISAAILGKIKTPLDTIKSLIGTVKSVFSSALSAIVGFFSPLTSVIEKVVKGIEKVAKKGEKVKDFFSFGYGGVNEFGGNFNVLHTNKPDVGSGGAGVNNITNNYNYNITQQGNLGASSLMRLSAHSKNAFNLS